MAGSAQPRISLLVAARNEEAVIRDLLAALAAQDYPHDRIQLLFADDGSTDATGDILAKWAGHFPDARVVEITEKLPGLVGKANALAHLGRLATGEILVFTDADCAPPPTWISAMVAGVMAQVSDPQTEAHILTAFTMPDGRKPFARLQAVDWLSALCVIHLLSLAGIAVSAAGNNMACTAAAYRLAGGFEATAGTITEDYALFHRILQVGGRFSHLPDSKALVFTHPQPDWPHWLRQRKRWFTGALQLPWNVQLPFWIQTFWYPVLILIGLLISWPLAVGLGFAKFGLQALIFSGYALMYRKAHLIPWLLLFDLWAAFCCWALLVAYRKDSRVEWKGVQYARQANGHREL